MRERNTKPTPAVGRARNTALDVEALLKRGTIAVVALEKVDLAKSDYCFREVVEPCDPATFLPRRGTIDGTGPHPIMLFEIGKHKYVTLNGLRRVLGMKRNPAVKRVRALVFSGISEHEATIIAARANLDHGVPLTCTEKRQAGLAEIQARLARGERLPPLRDLADVHHVVPQTIANWITLAKRNERANRVASHDDPIEVPGATPAAFRDQNADEPRESAASTPLQERTLDDVLDELDAASLELLHDFVDAEASAEHDQLARRVEARLQQWRHRQQRRGDAA